MRRAISTGRTTAAVLLTVLAATALSGCSVFDGPAPVPSPTRLAAQGVEEPDRTEPSPTASAEQVLPPGTVAAEADVVSKSGETSIHVRVVAETDGLYTAYLSDYRTTVPQPMAIQFRHRVANYLDGDEAGIRGSSMWDAASGPPISFTLDAGARPDYLRSAVLVPMPSESGDDADRPWVGSVLAVGTLAWRIPNPFPDLHVTAGPAVPGAYGSVREENGVPTTYTVAHGDELRTVAKRFGVSQDAILWMSPYAETRGEERWLLEDDVLNLDPANR